MVRRKIGIVDFCVQVLFLTVHPYFGKCGTLTGLVLKTNQTGVASRQLTLAGIPIFSTVTVVNNWSSEESLPTSLSIVWSLAFQQRMKSHILEMTKKVFLYRISSLTQSREGSSGGGRESLPLISRLNATPINQ